ncbi:hypothetical protein F4818DRAFT_455151 [Hypoxylon cercidicola]|nr:hypothetical protein F4818DRAFT_455151 [Hypoxylon cercidicola]
MSSVGSAASVGSVGTRNCCYVCDESLEGEIFPELVLCYFDRRGFEDDSKRQYYMCCMDCQLLSDEGALELLCAVEAMPEDMFYDDIIEDLIISLRLAKRLTPEFTRNSIVSWLVRAMFRWLSKLDLHHIFGTLIKVTDFDLSVSIMRRLAQLSFDVAMQQMEKLDPDHTYQHDLPDLALSTMTLESSSELVQFLDTLEDRVMLARSKYGLGDSPSPAASS